MNPDGAGVSRVPNTGPNDFSVSWQSVPTIASGDVDCDGDVDAVDALKVLRYVAGLSVDQGAGCPAIGAPVASLFGDVDCDEDVDAVDALKILRYVAGLSVSQEPGCPPVGG